MQIENFKVFIDLVESNSFSRAARINGITQSAVSQQIRSMEKHFHVVIVDRSQKSFRLTQEGEKLYGRIKDILRRYQQLSCELQEMKHYIGGNIHINATYAIGLYLLPTYLRAFMQAYPKVHLQLEYRRSNFIYEDVIHHGVDFGLVACPEAMRQLEIKPFYEEEMVIICHPKNKISNNQSLLLKKIKPYPLIGFDRDIGTRRLIDKAFKQQRLSITPSMEFDNIEMVKRAVEIDTGIAIVPILAVEREVKEGSLKMIPIEGKPLKRTIALIYRKNRLLTPGMKRFIVHLTGQTNITDIKSTSENDDSRTQLAPL